MTNEQIERIAKNLTNALISGSDEEVRNVLNFSFSAQQLKDLSYLLEKRV